MPLPSSQRPILVGVTGAQGVGKSTFCRNLVEALRREELGEIHLASGLGDAVRAREISIGRHSSSETIAVFYTEHLRREREATGITVLDRCAVDALAYTRALGVTDSVQLALYEEISALMISKLSVVVELEVGGPFSDSHAPHESPELRSKIAREISGLLSASTFPHLRTIASEPSAIANAVAMVRRAASA